MAAGIHSVAYTRVFADDDGRSCFEDGVLELDQQLSAPPAEPLRMTTLARLFGVPEDVMVVTGDLQWAGAPRHPAPARLLWAILSGTFEITVSAEVTRRFGTGDLVLVEDTSGEGHSSGIGSDGSLALVLRLPLTSAI